MRYVYAIAVALLLTGVESKADPLPASELFYSLKHEPDMPMYAAPILSGKPNAKTVVMLFDEHGSPMVEYERLVVLRTKYGISTVGVEGLVDPKNDNRARSYVNGESRLINLLIGTGHFTVLGLETAATRIQGLEAAAFGHMLQYEQAYARLQNDFPNEPWVHALAEAILNRTGNVRVVRRLGIDAIPTRLLERAEYWTDKQNRKSPIPIAIRTEVADAISMSVHADYATMWLLGPHDFQPSAKSFQEWRSVLQKKFERDLNGRRKLNWETIMQEFVLKRRDKVAIEILDRFMDERRLTHAAVVFGMGHAEGQLKRLKGLGYNVYSIEPFEGAKLEYETQYQYKEWYDRPLATIFPESPRALRLNGLPVSIPVVCPRWGTKNKNDEQMWIHLPEAQPNGAELSLDETTGSLDVTIKNDR